jgi:alpha-glucosidase
LRSRKIPVDAIYLDIDYQEKNRPFTVDRERFPHFEDMIQDFGKQGLKVIAITDLHVAKVPGAKSFEDGVKGDDFVKNPDGSVYVGKVWPGDAVFPDFTRFTARDWWGTLYTDFSQAGIRGFWNDMNEPALFERGDDKTMPLNNIHRVQDRLEDGGQDRLTDHREIHNVFGMQNVRATYEGLLKLNPDQRPFVLTRAAYAGTQRYAATWTGDNTASWNHMRLSISQLLNLGMSGYAFSGVDVGGFNGSPNPDLLTRWTELGLFYPMFRNHAAKETRNREPWVDGPEHEAIRKRYIETRYKLLPYIYSGMEENSRTGIPLLRPMFMEFPKETALATNGEEFMFGRSFLVAPKVWGFLQPYNVTLPQGLWYDYWTGFKVEGGKTFPIEPPLDTLPVYVRGGSIIPQQAVVQHVEEVPQGPLELHVYPGPDCSGQIYLDDGNTFAYRKGQYLRQSFTCEATDDHLVITMNAPEGSFQPWFREVRFTVHGVDRKVRNISTDENPSTNWKAEKGAVVSGTIPWDRKEHKISVAYSKL